MWTRRVAAGALAVVSVALATTLPAHAEGRNQAIHGDFNGDKFLDRAYLGTVAPDECAVVVHSGTASGGFAAPVAHVYLVPGGGRPVNCPDIGVADDLDPERGHDELIVSWFAGPPGSLPYTIIVLRDFRVAFTMVSPVFAPSFMGTTDFNGDGRPDVYQVTGQGGGFVSLLSLGDGALTPGPVRFCARPLSYTLRDFDHDGATDVLITYMERCDEFSRGVVVVLDDGTVVQLEDSRAEDERPHLTLHSYWSARVVDADGDGAPDVRTVNEATGEVHVFVNDGRGRFTLAPVAEDDVAQARRDRRTAITVLTNDVASSTARVTVVTQPRYGRAVVTSDRRIVYIPRDVPAGVRDRFVYAVTEEGRSDRAAVTVRFTG